MNSINFKEIKIRIMEIITEDSEKLKNEVISIKNAFKFQLKL